jgi:hypothetical protein
MIIIADTWNYLVRSIVHNVCAAWRSGGKATEMLKLKPNIQKRNKART